LIRKALGRVSFDGAPALTWEDSLPARDGGSLLLRPLFDLVSPFLPRAGLVMQYVARRHGDWLEIEGRSRAPRSARGEPKVRTRAWLSRAHGLVSVEVFEGGKVRRAVRRGEDGEIVRLPLAAREERRSSDAPSPPREPRGFSQVTEPLRSQPGES
jgi:hypothetical protein